MTEPFAEMPALPPPVPPSPLLIVEGLLFVASEPLGVADIARASGLAPELVAATLGELERLYAGRGIRIQHIDERVQLVSAPELAPYAERLLGGNSDTRLSSAALEVLAIIAYRQPITRAQVEAVRGVDSSGVLRQLLGRGLVAEAGRLEAVGRPILYATTPEFLRQFGLAALSELPAIDLPGSETPLP
jgi:segregation and condensation protein B